eukprot:gene28151-34853_t
MSAEIKNIVKHRRRLSSELLDPDELNENEEEIWNSLNDTIEQIDINSLKFLNVFPGSIPSKWVDKGTTIFIESVQPSKENRRRAFALRPLALWDFFASFAELFRSLKSFFHDIPPAVLTWNYDSSYTASDSSGSGTIVEAPSVDA